MNNLSDHHTETTPDLNKRKFLLMRQRPATAAHSNEAPLTTSESEEQTTSLTSAIISHIQINSANGQLTSYKSFLKEPLSLETSTLEATFQQMQTLSAYKNIVELKGEKDSYYYCSQKMSANYANMLFTMEERDICTAIAEAVRFDCKTYPRPYPVESLKNLPYCYTAEQIHTALKQLPQKDNLQDIQPVYASNDALYLFSAKFMTHAYARGLCEWIEVEQNENP